METLWKELNEIQEAMRKEQNSGNMYEKRYDTKTDNSSQGAAPRPVTCFKCQKPGHVPGNYTEHHISKGKDYRSKRNQQEGNHPQFYHCRGENHFTHDCRQLFYFEGQRRSRKDNSPGNVDASSIKIKEDRLPLSSVRGEFHKEIELKNLHKRNGMTEQDRRRAQKEQLRNFEEKYRRLEAEEKKDNIEFDVRCKFSIEQHEHIELRTKYLASNTRKGEDDLALAAMDSHQLEKIINCSIVNTPAKLLIDTATGVSLMQKKWSRLPLSTVRRDCNKKIELKNLHKRKGMTEQEWRRAQKEQLRSFEAKYRRLEAEEKKDEINFDDVRRKFSIEQHKHIEFLKKYLASNTRKGEEDLAQVAIEPHQFGEFIINCMIENTPAQLLIDTAAGTSLIQKDFVDRLKAGGHVLKRSVIQPIELHGITGHKLAIHGVYILNTKLGSKIYEILFHVSDNDNLFDCQGILGREVLLMYEMNLLMKEMCIMTSDNIIPFYQEESTTHIR